MGKASSEAKKKKKGRPPLLDIQERLLKQQKLQAAPPSPPRRQEGPSDARRDPAPKPSRHSARRNPDRDGPYPPSDWVSGRDDNDEERAEKKHRLLLGLDANLSTNSSGPCGSDSNASADNHEAALAMRRIGFGSDYPVITR